MLHWMQKDVQTHRIGIEVRTMQLETSRLILRPWTEADAEALYKHASDPEVGPPAGWPPHTSVENSRQIIRTVLSKPEVYAVCLKDGEPIGSVGLHLNGSTDMTDREDECELGYWLGKAFWGQGLIPEAANALLHHAFTDLGMRAVWCGYYEGNHKSRRVQEKLGFEYRYRTEGLKVTLMNETRTGYTNLMTKARWQKVQLFLAQKKTLDVFLSNGAITRAQYEKSFGDLREKMEMKL